eukprot:8737925-Pyramimonas_sp.AAC.1
MGSHTDPIRTVWDPLRILDGLFSLGFPMGRSGGSGGRRRERRGPRPLEARPPPPPPPPLHPP